MSIIIKIILKLTFSTDLYLGFKFTLKFIQIDYHNLNFTDWKAKSMDHVTIHTLILRLKLQLESASCRDSEYNEYSWILADHCQSKVNCSCKLFYENNSSGNML